MTTPRITNPRTPTPIFFLAIHHPTTKTTQQKYFKQMNYTLTIGHHTNPNPQRNLEYQQTLHYNLMNPTITQINLIQEDNTPTPPHPKIKTHHTGKRNTYNTYFKIANQTPGPHIIANSDIYFNQTLQQITPQHLQQYFIALSRHWPQPDGTLKLDEQAIGSQDAWITNQYPTGEQYEIPIGTPGCDNSLAHILTTNGYRLHNPCLTIQIIHNHNSHITNYPPPIPGPYLHIPPTTL